MMTKDLPDIIYTKVDEAPELASASFLPIIKAFTKRAGIRISTMDISLAGRIIANFPESLSKEQIISDDLADLGKIVLEPNANVIKLPNISASIPQLMAAISELQGQGYNIPDYPEFPANIDEEEIKARYDQIKGSAVNPVLREGNSDRRAARAVKRYAMKNPHSMGAWDSQSKTRVSSMAGGDFYSNEVSKTISKSQAGSGRIIFESADGSFEKVLRENLHYEEGTIVDATFLSVGELRKFVKEQVGLTKKDKILFSLHLKSTMMKVSDPIIFGHALSVFFEEVFKKFPTELSFEKVNPNSGLGEIFQSLEGMDNVKDLFKKVLDDLPKLYMVDSDRGITNFHVPSDVIIDASMPSIIRNGGKGWGPDGKPCDVNCVIPDRCYASIYDETIKYFIETGALDPSVSGSVDNVGLMAQKAEEYGSHPTTFEVEEDGFVSIVLENGEILHRHEVEKGDIWRSSTTKKAPIGDWIELAIERQAITGSKAVFWLDDTRAHDVELISYVKNKLKNRRLEGKFEVMSPRQATRFTLEIIGNGENIIAISGNVLRDYLTDLFPILELGTSAKMLSIVKLMNGGGLFETGAGGSAPKHVHQLNQENHLRWDSLGEFCALGESLKYFASKASNEIANILGEGVEVATQSILDNDKSPMRKVGQPDNRSSHFYFALYWAQYLSKNIKDPILSIYYINLFKDLKSNEAIILSELFSGSGTEVDLSGYFHPDPAKVSRVMRPSDTFNKIIDKI
ncbi:MAG: NADP-dependent isocitrate dehydrogenase [Paracoccaceae bacterium]|nr:NADP-dependent isocitrate dehydrogenase [Paracoccaceae bacterium]